MEGTRGRKRVAKAPKEEVEGDQEIETEKGTTGKSTTSKKSNATANKKQKTEKAESSYDIIERMLMEEKARDFESYCATIDKLKKLFDAEVLNVDAHKCGKEFLQKFSMPTKPTLKKIMEGFKCTEYEVLEQRGHDSLVERVVVFCDDQITIKLQSSMDNYETSYTCFAYAKKSTFRVDEIEEVTDIFENLNASSQEEFKDFFTACKPLIGKVTAGEFQSLLTSIVTTLDTIWV